MLKLMSARQAAQALGVSKAYACRLFANGIIPAQKVDTDWVVERKEVQAYLDDRAGIAHYYRNTDGWCQDDYYFLYRMLDRMVNNRKGRYDREIESIDTARLNEAAKAILVALGAPAKYASLGDVSVSRPLCPPLLLCNHPSMGAYPEFEKVGLIL